MTRLGLSLRVGALALALLAVSGCSGEEAGPVVLSEATPTASASTPTTTPTTTPSSSKTPTSTGSTSAGEFDAGTQEDAEQFVRRYFETLNAVTAGEASANQIKPYSLPGCATCESIYEDAATIDESGQYTEDAFQELQELQFDTNNGSVALVKAVVQARPGTLLDSSGAVVRTLDGAPPVTFILNLVQTDDGWIIQDILNLGQ